MEAEEEEDEEEEVEEEEEKAKVGMLRLSKDINKMTVFI